MVLGSLVPVRVSNRATGSTGSATCSRSFAEGAPEAPSVDAPEHTP